MSSRRRQGGVRVPEVAGSNHRSDESSSDNLAATQATTPQKAQSPEAEESSVKDGSGRKSERSPRVDRSDPAFVPTNGQFFLHDNRGGGRGGRGHSNQEDDDRTRYASFRPFVVVSRYLLTHPQLFPQRKKANSEHVEARLGQCSKPAHGSQPFAQQARQQEQRYLQQARLDARSWR